MKNWIIELEDQIGSEDAAIAVQLLAAALIVTTVLIGNWYLVF